MIKTHLIAIIVSFFYFQIDCQRNRWLTRYLPARARTWFQPRNWWRSHSAPKVSPNLLDYRLKKLKNPESYADQYYYEADIMKQRNKRFKELYEKFKQEKNFNTFAEDLSNEAKIFENETLKVLPAGTEILRRDPIIELHKTIELNSLKKNTLNWYKDIEAKKLGTLIDTIENHFKIEADQEIHDLYTKIMDQPMRLVEHSADHLLNWRRKSPPKKMSIPQLKAFFNLKVAFEKWLNGEINQNDFKKIVQGSQLLLGYQEDDSWTYILKKLNKTMQDQHDQPKERETSN